MNFQEFNDVAKQIDDPEQLRSLIRILVDYCEAVGQILNREENNAVKS